MLYKSSLQFFFHPKAFGPRADSLDAPISLSYIANPSTGPLTTTLRFFLQFLRAALQALPRQSTRISSLLKLISSSWDTALLISESERRLRLETLTTSEIKGDERLDIVSEILLRDVKTKVQASLELEAKIIGDGKELRMGVDVAPNVRVVYGEEYNEKNMTEYLKGLVDGELQGWDAAVRQMKTKLIARGAKGARK
jgi:kinetochore protein Spc7/SPC105